MTLAALMLAGAPAWPADQFLRNMRKGQERKEPEERVEYMSRAIKAWTPSHQRTLLANCHLRRGEARVELYEFKLAEPDLTRAIELDPGAARAFQLRGRARLRLGQASAAARDLREYSAFKPEDLEAWLDLGDAELARGGRAAAALEAFGRAQQLAPSDSRPALGAARAHMSRKDWKTALERLQEADDDAKGKSPEVLNERAVCRVALGRHDLALLDYSSALPLLERRVEAKRRVRGPAAAFEEERDLLARTYYARARVHDSLARTAGALRDYQQACDLGHEPGCERLASARAAAAPKRPPRPKRRRAADESGPRIYAN